MKRKKFRYGLGNSKLINIYREMSFNPKFYSERKSLASKKPVNSFEIHSLVIFGNE